MAKVCGGEQFSEAARDILGGDHLLRDNARVPHALIRSLFFLSERYEPQCKSLSTSQFTERPPIAKKVFKRKSLCFFPSVFARIRWCKHAD